MKILRPVLSSAFVVLILCLLLGATTGCSWVAWTGLGSSKSEDSVSQKNESALAPPSVAASKVSSVELFFARSALNLAEYEQYQLSEAGLFWECGQITRGRYVPDHQSLDPIGVAQQQEIREVSATIVESLKQAPATLPETGKLRSLADPGQFLVTFVDTDGKEFQIRTSHDAVANRELPTLRRLYSLAQQLRAAVGGEPCGNKQFYGITQRSG